MDIIIVNYKSSDCLAACLESVYHSLGSIPARIRIQNNDPQDDLTKLAQMYPNIILRTHERNLGFAAAVNTALRESPGPYVLLINPDTIVSDCFFYNILSFMKNHPDIGIVGPKILDPQGTVQGSARSFPTPLTGLFGRSSFLTKILPNNPLTRANMVTHKCNGNTPIDVDWVSGACMLVRRSAIESVGLLDPRFFMYWEDADWCKRMWERGWKVVYYPKASIIHYGGRSSSKRMYRSVLDFHKSTLLLFMKYSRGIYRWFAGFVYLALTFRASCLMASAFLFNNIRKGLRKTREDDSKVISWHVVSNDSEFSRRDVDKRRSEMGEKM